MTPQFCPQCGTALDSSGTCQNPSCAGRTSKPTHSNLGQEKKREWGKTPFSFSEKGKRIVPDCVEPDRDEVPIRQYDIARLQTLIKGAVAEGRLQVTNKRVLFRSSGHSVIGPTSLHYEFSIEEIAGIEFRKEARFNLLATVLLILAAWLIMTLFGPLFGPVYRSELVGLLFSILLTAAAALSYIMLRPRKFLRHIVLSFLMAGLPLTDSLLAAAFGFNASRQGLVNLAAATIFLLSLLSLAFAPNLVINIKTKGGTPSVEIRRKDGLFSFQHNEYTGFFQVLPGPDVDAAMHELGAVIREIQQTGSYSNTDQ